MKVSRSDVTILLFSLQYFFLFWNLNYVISSQILTPPVSLHERETNWFPSFHGIFPDNIRLLIDILLTMEQSINKYFFIFSLEVPDKFKLSNIRLAGSGETKLWLWTELGVTGNYSKNNKILVKNGSYRKFAYCLKFEVACFLFLQICLLNFVKIP